MSGRCALNLATVFPADLEHKLYAAGRAGFRAVGLLLSDMARAGEAGLEELRLSQLAVAEIVGLTGWADPDHATRAVALRHAEQAFALAYRVQAEVVVAAAPCEPVDLLSVTDRFRELCRLAAPYAVRVGLEFHAASERVRTIASAWTVVEGAGAENGGLVLDTFHCYQGESAVEMLEPVPGDRVFLVQLADCMEMPKYELENRHRVYPGTGTIAFEPLLGALSEKNYAGYYSVELYNEDYWLEDPILVAQDAMRSLRRLELPYGEKDTL